MISQERAAAKALRLHAKAASIETLALELVDQGPPPVQEGHAVVQVHAAAVNPSDVKAALGMMPHAVWPRTPGRDFAGRVVAGPADWLGVSVWGTGGDLALRAMAAMRATSACRLRPCAASPTRCPSPQRRQLACPS